MKILVACEVSGRVREAFAAKGHDAWSCDLQPSMIPGKHIQDNVFNHLTGDWDMMIAFPPCTHLAVSGARYFKDKHADQGLAILDFIELALCPIPKIAIENPVGIMSTRFRKPDQIIQPYEYGHPESKRTCLWLSNLPRLVPTNILTLPPSGRWNNQTPSGQNKLGPSPQRAKLRGLTYEGIAKAMADQWG